ncbi:MAG: hypothetical protein IKK38_03890 [Spirochaetaceae bacterium]|nr:hypothetical protein [Spirochaetaceae bacterium]
MEIKDINEAFFFNLAAYATENNLSDVIAAACNSSQKFKELFLDFFFRDEKLINKITGDIEREVWSDDGTSRFDFYIRTIDNVTYVVENKIYDLNDHYNEYTKYFDEKNIGFIANYDVKDIPYSNKHSWEEFYNYLYDHKSDVIESERFFLDYILIYIKKVCGIMEKRDFNISKLEDLGYFMALIKGIMEKNGYKINNQVKASKDGYIGFWGIKDQKQLWFCLNYYAEKYFENDKKFYLWCGRYDYTPSKKSVSKLTYSGYDPDADEATCSWFYLKDEYLDKLCSYSSYNDKYEVLNNFLLEIDTLQ